MFRPQRPTPWLCQLFLTSLFVASGGDLPAEDAVARPWAHFKSGHRALITRPLEVKLRLKSERNNETRAVLPGSLVKVLSYEGTMLAADDWGCFKVDESQIVRLTNDLNECLRSFDSFPEADQAFARGSYFSRVELKKAAENFQKALTNNPDHGPARIALAKVFLELNRPDGAIEQLKKITETNNEYPLAQCYLARIQKDEKLLDKIAATAQAPQAAFIFLQQQLLEDEPQPVLTSVFEHLIVAASEFGPSPAAMQTYAEAMTSDVFTENNLNKDVHLQAAESSMGMLLESDPWNVHACKILGQRLFSRSMLNPREATVWYDRGLSANPLSAECCAFAGFLLSIDVGNQYQPNSPELPSQKWKLRVIGSSLHRLPQADIPLKRGSDISPFLHGYARVNHGIENQANLLHRLAERGDGFAIEYLTNYFELDFLQENAEGKIPLQVAIESDHPFAATVLTELMQESRISVGAQTSIIGWAIQHQKYAIAQAILVRQTKRFLPEELVFPPEQHLLDELEKRVATDRNAFIALLKTRWEEAQQSADAENRPDYFYLADEALLIAQDSYVALSPEQHNAFLPEITQNYPYRHRESFDVRLPYHAE